MNNDYSQNAITTVSETRQCLKLSGGLFSRATAGIIIEKELAISVNGEHLATASIIPGMEREFVTGYLYGQGFIDGLDDLRSVEIDDSGAAVTLKDSSRMTTASGTTTYRIVSGGGRAAFSDSAAFPFIGPGMAIRKDDVFAAMNTVFERGEIYRETEGVHIGGLFSASGAPLRIVEDIGRHNTLDKLIGHALLNGIDFGQAFIASTGRMSSEMVLKICRAGIPVAATKTAVTDRGIEIGREHGLTVIGFVRDAGTRINTDMDVRVIQNAGMKVYTHPERVLCE